ncbi:MAG: PH domain-containing protein [Actinomycetia bacterium]|nr:PH domain-containing protein [Actinomycetes bacterium]
MARRSTGHSPKEETAATESAYGRMTRDIERAERNNRLLEHLTETEVIRLATRQHMIVLWKPVLAMFVATVLLLNIADTGEEGAGRVGLAIFVASVIWFGVGWLHWFRNIFVATDRRILKVYGVWSTTVDSMRNTKVTDIKYRRSPLGEILGYGSITIESAGQDQALHDIDCLPYPRENYRELLHSIFGESPRSTRMRRSPLLRLFDRVTGRSPARRSTGGNAGGERPVVQFYDTDDDLDYTDIDHPAPEGADEHAPAAEAGPRVLYSSSDGRSAPTGVIPLYPPGYFDERRGNRGDDEQPR